MEEKIFCKNITVIYRLFYNIVKKFDNKIEIISYTVFWKFTGSGKKFNISAPYKIYYDWNGCLILH